ncbi:MAG: hypothetical protein QM802_13500 [Agriterribacter sp.]
MLKKFVLNTKKLFSAFGGKMQHMKRLLISIFICGFNFSYGQQQLPPVNIDSDGHLFVQIDTSKYFDQDVYFGKLLTKTIHQKKTVSSYEEFIRYTDSSYVYVKYDSVGKVISKGLLTSNRKNFIADTILTPDTKKDPTMAKGIMKNIVLRSYPLDKALYWMETDSNENVFHGVYLNGKRNGIWKQGHNQYPTQSNEIFIIDTILKYNNGIQDVRYQPDYSIKTLWPILKGRWWYSMSSVDEQYILTQKKEFYPFYTFNFIDQQYIQVNRGHTIEKLRWELKDGVLFILGTQTLKLRIKYISTDKELYLTPLND